MDGTRFARVYACVQPNTTPPPPNQTHQSRAGSESGQVWCPPEIAHFSFGILEIQVWVFESWFWQIKTLSSSSSLTYSFRVCDIYLCCPFRFPGDGRTDGRFWFVAAVPLRSISVTRGPDLVFGGLPWKHGQVSGDTVHLGDRLGPTPLITLLLHPPRQIWKLCCQTAKRAYKQTRSASQE